MNMEIVFFDLGASLLALVAILILLVLSALIGTLRLSNKEGLLSFFSTVGGFFYIPFLLAFLLGIVAVVEGRFLGHPFTSHYASAFVFMIFAGIWLCDSGAYFAGRTFGKHKLFERVSPKKTWEGAIGGAVVTIVGVTICTIWLFPNSQWFDGVILGTIIGIMGQIGDLVESLIKRACRVKDSSQIIPGHGGILDRFDSLLFVVPVVYLYVYWRGVFESSLTELDMWVVENNCL